MKAVWKFPLMIEELQAVEMPAGAALLHVDVTPATPGAVDPRLGASGPHLWALVDPDAPRTQRLIGTVGTGQLIDDTDPTPRPYVGTYLLSGGALVFHVFDGGER